MEIFKENGIPRSDKEIDELIKEFSLLNEVEQASVDSIPSLKSLLIPLLKVMSDKKP